MKRPRAPKKNGGKAVSRAKKKAGSKGEKVRARKEKVEPPRLSKKALDVKAYDEMLADVFFYVREKLRQISLREAERRSKISHQFWSKVEKGKCSLSAHTEAIMCNALQVKPSAMHRFAERCLLLGRKLTALVLWLLLPENGEWMESVGW